MNDLVEKYFNSQASAYQDGWEKWPGSQIRGSESKAVLSLLPNITQKTIAEFGSGSGYYTRLLLKSNPEHIYAIDFSQEMLNNLPTGAITPVRGDANIVELEQKFSCLVSTGMLEFIETPKVALKNMAKHALPNATLVLLIPINNLWGRLYQLFHKKNGLNIHLFNLKTFGEFVSPKWKIKSLKKCGLFSAAIRLSLA